MARLLEGALSAQGKQHVQAGRTAAFDKTGKLDVAAEAVSGPGDVHHMLKGGVLGIEIQDAPVGVHQIFQTTAPNMQRNGAQVRQKN